MTTPNKPTEPGFNRDCPSCKHSDSYGVPDRACKIACQPTADGKGSNFVALNKPTDQPSQQGVTLLPCPFCGAGETHIVENGKIWTGMKYSEPTSVSVRHHCEPTKGQPSRMLERVGKDHESAIAAWNMRAALSQPTAPEQASGERPLDTLRRQMKEVTEAAYKTPGVAVKIPELVAAEGRKFMRGEPSLFDQLPFAEVQTIGSTLGSASTAAPEAAKPEMQGERAELIDQLEESAKFCDSVDMREFAERFRKAAALLAADKHPATRHSDYLLGKIDGKLEAFNTLAADKPAESGGELLGVEYQIRHKFCPDWIACDKATYDYNKDGKTGAEVREVFCYTKPQADKVGGGDDRGTAANAA